VISQQNLTGSSYTLTSSLTPGHSYSWWIGVPSGVSTIWSTPQTFSIPALAAPTLNSPAGAVVTTTPTFTWSVVSGAATYSFWMEDLTTKAVTQLTGLTNTTCTLPQPLTVGHSYTWFAGAISLNNQATFWSGPQYFNIAPIANSPSGVIGSQLPTFTWTGVPGVTLYWLWINDQTTNTAAVISQQNLTGSSYALTSGLTPGHSYSWWIGAANGGTTAWSAPQTFSIPALAAPTLNDPAGAVVTTTPTFTWSAVSGAATYSFWMEDLTTKAVTQLTGLTSTSCALPQPLTVGHSYTWFAGAVSLNNQATFWSGPQYFTIAPIANSPSGVTGSQLPTFTWTGVAGVTSYWLWINDQTTNTAAVVSQQNLTGSSYTLTGGLTPGHSYTWWIGAANGSTTAWSASQTFTIPALAAPVALGPSGTISTTTPTFSWNAVSGADHYDVWVNNVTTGVRQVVRNQDVTGTALTLSAAQALQTGDMYVFWVAAVSTNGLVEVWSQSLQFTVTL
jgi:hypothetical protein